MLQFTTSQKSVEGTPASLCSAGRSSPRPAGPRQRCQKTGQILASGPHAPQTLPTPARVAPCAGQSHGLETGTGQQPPSARRSPAPFCQLSPYQRIWHLLHQQHREDPGLPPRLLPPSPPRTPRALTPGGVWPLLTPLPAPQTGRPGAPQAPGAQRSHWVVVGDLLDGAWCPRGASPDHHL